MLIYFQKHYILKIAKKQKRRDTKIIKKGEPGYAKHLDRDRDGIACESK